MLAGITSFGLYGIEGQKVAVEVDLSRGLPGYEIVGLPDAAVRESRERVRAAIVNSGYDFPQARITVNLAPADMKKEGSVYDLPMALGILAAEGVLPIPEEGCLVLGELALDGRIRGVRGVTPMLISAMEAGYKKALLPLDNANEAACLEGMEIYAANSLKEAVEHFKGEKLLAPTASVSWLEQPMEAEVDFREIRGQQGAKRAAEIAAAGGHNLLLVGTPGSGKTMLARAFPSILPELSYEEALSITRIHSAAGQIRAGEGILRSRPFRTPHHSASTVALVGGGINARPGEISLAHYGVLFLDEFPEFKREAMEALRQPLEDGTVTITRANFRASYPADFMLIAAMNPCPCGNYGSRSNECRCSPFQIRRYLNRVSGPMLDRIDLHVEMSEVGYGDIVGKEEGESSASIRKRVNAARSLQKERYRAAGLSVLFNAQLGNRDLERFAAPDAAGKKLLKNAYEKLNLSARAYYRILRVSRSIADLEASENVREQHILEAIQYRSLDRKYWE